MSTRVVEMPIIGKLTGSEIAARGWPVDGVGYELEHALKAASAAEFRAPWWRTIPDGGASGDDRIRLQARCRRLQVLAFMAGHRRHARQATRLGEHDDGVKHLATLFPAQFIELAAWRALQHLTIRPEDVREILYLTNSGYKPQDRVQRWRGPYYRMIERGHWPTYLGARIERYVEGLADRRWY